VNQPAAHGTGAYPLVAPVAVCVVDVESLPDVIDLPGGPHGECRSVMVVARRAGDPLGIVTLPATSPAVSVEREQLFSALEAQLGGNTWRAPASSAEPCPLEVSIVVPTCRDPVRLERCLTAVLRSEHARFEVIVVENRPGTGATRTLLEGRFGADDRIRYAIEPAPGLARARNTGAAHATGDIVVFIDDDVTVDSRWLSRITDAFARSDVACVTGLVLPFRLDTPAQVLLEQLTRFGKGFERRRFQLPESHAELPLLPYTAGLIGTGANTAIRADALREIGGFDTALGTGTLACGGEDLDLYMRLLQSGRAIAYEPAALVWHDHPETLRHVRRQAFRYGVGLSAALFKQLVHGPHRRRLVLAAPAGLQYAASPHSPKNAVKGAEYPRMLSMLETAGFALGPAAYVGSLAASRWRRPA
jgi:GT2 family glycosyltransferase